MHVLTQERVTTAALEVVNSGEDTLTSYEDLESGSGGIGRERVRDGDGRSLRVVHQGRHKPGFED
jgi:hypothetical protein